MTATNVSKPYGDTLALTGVSRQRATGRIVGLLGCSGAGKATLLKILLGLARQILLPVGRSGGINDNA